MKKIDSFTIDHTRMLEGIYVSRKDTTPSGDVLTTIDIRMKWPNHTYIQPKAMHTIEHLAATFLRNDEELGAKVVYFGPMGCATGFYLILQGDWESHQLVHPLQRLMASIRDYKGEVPGTTMKECANDRGRPPIRRRERLLCDGYRRISYRAGSRLRLFRNEANTSSSP